MGPGLHVVGCLGLLSFGILRDGLSELVSSALLGEFDAADAAVEFLRRRTVADVVVGGDRTLQSLTQAVRFELQLSGAVAHTTALEPLADAFSALGVGGLSMRGFRDRLDLAIRELRELCAIAGGGTEVYLRTLLTRLEAILRKVDSEGTFTDELAELVAVLSAAINRHPAGERLARRANVGALLFFAAAATVSLLAWGVSSCLYPGRLVRGVFGCWLLVLLLSVPQFGVVYEGYVEACPAVVPIAEAYAQHDGGVVLKFDEEGMAAIARLPAPVYVHAQVGAFFSAKSAFVEQLMLALLPPAMRPLCTGSVVVRNLEGGVGRSSETLTRGTHAVLLPLSLLVLHDLEPVVREAVLRMTDGKVVGTLVIVDAEGVDAMNTAHPGVDGLVLQHVHHMSSHVVFASRVRGSTASFLTHAHTAHLARIGRILTGAHNCPSTRASFCAVDVETDHNRLVPPTASFRVRDGADYLTELEARGVPAPHLGDQIRPEGGHRLYLPVRLGATGVQEADAGHFRWMFGGAFEFIALPPVSGELSALNHRPATWLHEYGCPRGTWWCRRGVAFSWLHAEIPHVLARTRPKQLFASRRFAGLSGAADCRPASGEELVAGMRAFERHTRDVFSRIAHPTTADAAVKEEACSMLSELIGVWATRGDSSGVECELAYRACALRHVLQSDALAACGESRLKYADAALTPHLRGALGEHLSTCADELEDGCFATGCASI